MNAVVSKNPLVGLEQKIASFGDVKLSPENRRIMEKWVCLHCHEIVGEIYMVHNSIWERTGFGKHDGVLHIRCIEALIGRSLQLTDFTSSSINDGIRWAYQLGLRS